MPSKSAKQARTMRLACKSESFRKKVQIPKSVACKYMRHDQAAKKSRKRK